MKILLADFVEYSRVIAKFLFLERRLGTTLGSILIFH